jgi:adenosylcobinamide-phosphate synthase
LVLALIIGIAFILDLIFGDPHWLPHPICFIGNIISFLEKKIRKMIYNEFIGGMILSIAVLILSFTIPYTILFLTGKINFYLKIFVEIYFCYQIFAVKSLKTESIKVYKPLIKGSLEEARKNLSYIVGRDTQNLDEKGITKATVETIAENTTDGVVAPLIFMAIGGAPLAFLYKAVNTMDSMIGYKTKKYFYFGKFAAKLDDVLNYLPARITAFLMIVSSAFLRLDIKNAIKIYLRDKSNHKSPNSAHTESVCAGALNIQIAGNAYYFGKLILKPTIGDNNRDIEFYYIILANKLMYTTSILAVIFVIIIRGVLV